METVLALDIGDKRVGTAWYSGDARIVLPHTCFLRAAGEAEKAILAFVAERGVKKILAGLPLDKDGKPTAQSEKVLAFCRRLQKRSDISIIYVDEFLSSEDAQERLKAQGKNVQEAKHSGLVDCVVAALLLEGYLAGHIPALKVPE